MIVTEVEDLQKEMGEIKKELQNSTQKISEIEQKIQKLDNKVETVAKDKPKVEVMMEYRAMETHLRLSGIEENMNEDIHQKVIGAIAEFLGKQTDEITYNFDLI